MEPVVVMLSGGINSVVAATRTLHDVAPHFLYVDYGHQAAQAERRSVEQISEALAGTLHVVELPTFARKPSTPSAAGAGSPASESSPPAPPGNRRPPGLMLTMLGLAQQLATGVGAEQIVCGISQTCNESDLDAGAGQGDPDTRHVFVHAALIAMEMGLSTKRRLILDIPFVEAGRTDVVRTGFRLGAPLHLTWSCHLSGDQPCGQCLGCQSRAAAFKSLGQDDPRLAPAS